MMEIDFSQKTILLAVHHRWCLDLPECLCGPGDILAQVYDFIGQTFPSVPLGSFTTGPVSGAER